MSTIASRKVRLANNAGYEPHAPLLVGLGLLVVIVPYSAPSAAPSVTLRPSDVDADGAVSLTSQLSPPVGHGVIAGVNAVLDTDAHFTKSGVANWAAVGFSAGDFIYLLDTSGEMKTAVYEIADVGNPSADVMRLLNPYRDDGQILWPLDADKTGLTYRACWKLLYDTSGPEIQTGMSGVAAGEPSAGRSAADFTGLARKHTLHVTLGTKEYDAEFYVLACSNANMVFFDGLPWAELTTGKGTADRIAVDFCRDAGFSNRGGIGTVEIVSGAVYWDPAHTQQGEITLEQALTCGVYYSSAGDGNKAVTFRFRARRGDSVYKDTAVTITVAGSFRVGVNAGLV